jgi:endonuclease/exonuclease/phosphatase family metal-dependent hydrolase
MNRTSIHTVIAAALLLLVGAALLHAGQGCERSVRVTTFNVELFPKHPGHGQAVFEQIDALESPVVAVQEIEDASQFRTDARRVLGSSWRYVGAEHCERLCLGILFDSNRVELLQTETHQDTQIHRGARPVLEAVLEVDGRPVSVFVVHLKAKPDGVSLREKQLRALTRIINERRPRRTEFVVVGDFNSVTQQDQRLLSRFSESTGLAWNSTEVECSHYWQRESTCLTSTLDHVFSSVEGAQARPNAACATLGCDMGRTCPVYRKRVSDHCPVTVELD